MNSQAIADDDILAMADIPVIQRILEVVSLITGMGFATVARVTENRWTACAIYDTLEFGLAPGGELDIKTTICDEVRSADALVAIDHVEKDPDYCGHPTPAMYGFQSYISVPIRHTDGTFFGTLCALDPQPVAVNTPRIITMFELFADVIGEHLSAKFKLVESEAALYEAHETAQLRDQFIAVLGHDLRSPLASLSSGTRILAAQELDGRSAQVVDLMRVSISRMSDLVNNVLDFARGKLGGGIPVERELTTDLATVLEHVVDELRSVWNTREIATEYRLDRPVYCDKSRMEQLASNLLSNALIHGAEDEPVRLEAGVTDGFLELSVTNAGEPIPCEARAQLFRPFKRNDARKSVQGLGLGLFIAAEIVRGHGGTLDYVSDETETVFTARFPAAAE